MKKIILSLTVVAFLAFACVPKASRGVTDTTIPLESTVSSDPAAIEAGHTIFTTKCTRCHGEKPIHKWTYAKLRPVLASMAQKAKLTTTETGQVCAYVHANCKKVS